MWWHDEEIPGDERPDRALPFGEMMRRVAPLFRPHRRLLAGGVTLMLVSVGAELAGPVVLWRLFDVAIPEGSRGALLSGGLLFAFFFLVGIAATYLQIVLVTRMGLAIVTDLKKRLFDHLLDLSLAYFDRQPAGAAAGARRVRRRTAAGAVLRGARSRWCARWS